MDNLTVDFWSASLQLVAVFALTTVLEARFLQNAWSNSTPRWLKLLSVSTVVISGLALTVAFHQAMYALLWKTYANETGAAIVVFALAIALGVLIVAPIGASFVQAFERPRKDA